MIVAQINSLKVPMMMSLDNLRSDLYHIGKVLNQGQISLFMQDLSVLLRKIEPYVDSDSGLSITDESRVTTLIKKAWIFELEGWLTQHAASPLLNGTLIFDKQGQITEWTSLILDINEVHSLSGYLASLARALTNSTDFSLKLVYTSAFIVAAKNYIKILDLMKRNKASYNPKKAIVNILDSVNAYLEFIQFIQKSENLFNALFYQYETDIIQFIDQFCVMSSAELLKAHSEGLRLLLDKVGEFKTGVNKFSSSAFHVKLQFLFEVYDKKIKEQKALSQNRLGKNIKLISKVIAGTSAIADILPKLECPLNVFANFKVNPSYRYIMGVHWDAAQFTVRKSFDQYPEYQIPLVLTSFLTAQDIKIPKIFFLAESLGLGNFNFSFYVIKVDYNDAASPLKLGINIYFNALTQTQKPDVYHLAELILELPNTSLKPDEKELLGVIRDTRENLIKGYISGHITPLYWDYAVLGQVITLLQCYDRSPKINVISHPTTAIETVLLTESTQTILRLKKAMTSHELSINEDSQIFKNIMNRLQVHVKHMQLFTLLAGFDKESVVDRIPEVMWNGAQIIQILKMLSIDPKMVIVPSVAISLYPIKNEAPSQRQLDAPVVNNNNEVRNDTPNLVEIPQHRAISAVQQRSQRTPQHEEEFSVASIAKRKDYLLFKKDLLSFIQSKQSRGSSRIEEQMAELSDELLSAYNFFAEASDRSFHSRQPEYLEERELLAVSDRLSSFGVFPSKDSQVKKQSTSKCPTVISTLCSTRNRLMLFVFLTIISAVIYKLLMQQEELPIPAPPPPPPPPPEEPPCNSIFCKLF